MAFVKLAIVDADDNLALIDMAEVDDLMDQLSEYVAPVEMADNDDEDDDEDEDDE